MLFHEEKCNDAEVRKVVQEQQDTKVLFRTALYASLRHPTNCIDVYYGHNEESEPPIQSGHRSTGDKWAKTEACFQDLHVLLSGDHIGNPPKETS